MREPEIIEAELVEISAMADDEMKLNSIIVWCTTHPDEIPFAMHILLEGKSARKNIASSGEVPEK
jgi:hypothetical protein